MESESFSSFLTKWMEAGGWNVPRVATSSGIADAVIRRWLGDNPMRPSDANLRRLAPVIGVAPEELLRMCGYLPGEAQIDRTFDPELAATTAALQEAWPSWDDGFRLAVQLLIGGGAVQPTQRRSNGRADALSKRLRERQSALEARPSTTGESNPDGSLGHPLESVVGHLVHVLGALASPERRASLPALSL